MEDGFTQRWTQPCGSVRQKVSTGARVSRCVAGTSRQFIGFKVCFMGENSHPTVNLATDLWMGRSWAFEGDLLLLLC